MSLSLYTSWANSSVRIQIPYEWPDILVDELRDLVSYGFVTANPCDLGVIMKQPCWQVCTPPTCLFEPGLSVSAGVRRIESLGTVFQLDTLASW